MDCVAKFYQLTARYITDSIDESHEGFELGQIFKQTVLMTLMVNQAPRNISTYYACGQC